LLEQIEDEGYNSYNIFGRQESIENIIAIFLGDEVVVLPNGGLNSQWTDALKEYQGYSQIKLS